MVRVIFLCKFVHLFALLFCPSDCELWFTKNWISEKSIVNTCKMFTLRSTFLQHLFHAFQARCTLFVLRSCHVEHHEWVLSLSRSADQNCPQVLRTTRITLHCPIRGSSLSHSWWMGCWRYSAASRLGMLLGEDDFRSFSQALELGDVLLLSQMRVTILLLWSQCRVPPPESCSPTGLPVLVWSSSSIFEGIDTQLWIDFDPSTGLSVLVECMMSSWPKKISFPISWVDLVHPRVSQLLTIGFLVLVGFVGCLSATNLNHTSNSLCGNFSVVVEVTHTPSGIWILQMPRLTHPLSKLYIDPIRRVLVSFPRMMQDVVWSGSLWSLFMGFTAVKNTVCLSLLEFLSSRCQSWLCDGV